MVKIVTATFEQDSALKVARVGFMSACPFYAHLFYSEMKEVLTTDIPTLATDGKNVFINPEYIVTLKPAEAVFAYAHEMSHWVSRHCQRLKHYSREGDVRGKKFDAHQFNQAADYIINAGLMEEGVGLMNASWLYRSDVSSEELVEDVYERLYKKPPEGNGPGGKPSNEPGQTYGGSGKAPKGSRPDRTAEANGGGFDELLPPPVDPVTGKEDTPDEATFKEAIARAATAAKAMGNLPARIQRQVDGILEAQVDWRDHVRMLMTGHIGARHETWNRPNRRRLVLNPLVIMPGRRGYGAECVAVVVDNSGSISEKELSAYFGEIGAVLADVRPKKVILIWCDAQIQQVDEAGSLDELAEIRVHGAPGGGGTSFIPPFDYLRDNDIKPETLIYCTDMMGRFPNHAPDYPVIWCATTPAAAPWGDVVRIEVEVEV